MAEENQAAAAGISPEQAANAQFQIQKLYVKDISFELPNAPEIFQEQGQADVKMSLAQRVEDMGENLMEVVLTITVTASMGDKTAYLAEIAQAGIFLVSGFNDQMKHMVMNTLCPNTLFPYARRAISAMVSEGGFPPLVLQPVNFEQLYAKRMQDLANQQNGAGAQSANGELPAAEFKTQA
jgi:preprotein translocase subunit SecB